jgi:hypothetical protein
MVIMRKIFSIMLSVVILAAFVTSTAYAEDAKNIEFGQIEVPQGYAEAASHTPSYSFQLWHHSGGYWSNETYGVKLMDTEVEEGINTLGKIEYNHPVTISADLPNKVKEYFTRGGDIDDVLVKFEITNGLRDHQIFNNIPTYSLSNGQITISFEPKFNVHREYLVTHPGMKVHVPIILEGYGKMVYSVFTPSGTHLGMNDDIEPQDIIDCNGNLRDRGKLYGYRQAGQAIQYSAYNNIKIGDGTFANGGAVGLEYLFPIRVTYYLPGEPDFNLTTNQAIYEGEPGETVTAWVTIHNKGEVASATDIGSNWQGEGNNWATTQFYYSDASIGVIPAKSSRTPVSIPIKIPDTAKTIWFKANVDGNTPANEANQGNNLVSAIVRPKPKNADVGVTITVSDTKPQEWRYVTATAKVTNYGPETADIYFEIGENNGVNQEISWADIHNLTLAPGQSKSYSYDSESNEGGAVLYMAAKATVTNTTDPKLSNNFARTPKIVWQKYIPPESEPSELESSLIH